MNSELRRISAICEWVRFAEPSIVRVFRDNKIYGQLGRLFITPQLAVWPLYLTNLKLSDVKRVSQLDLALESALGTPGVRIRQQGRLLLEVPLPRECRTHLPARSLPLGEGLCIPVGVTYDGTPYWIDFNTHPHLLVVGTTQAAGKSETLKTIAWLLARQNRLSDLSLFLVDLKGGLALKHAEAFAHSPYPVATSPEEAAKLIQRLSQIQDQRFAEGSTRPSIFLFVDEAFVLTQKWKEASNYLARLASQGRGANIHLVLATQRATKEALGNTSIISANIPARLVGKVDSAASSALALGLPQGGAEELLGNGDMIGNLTGQPVRLQVGLWDENPEPVPVSRTRNHEL